MFFISGALFPSGDLPDWLDVLNRLDPITWFGWSVPIALPIFTIFALGMPMPAIAIAEFNAGD